MVSGLLISSALALVQFIVIAQEAPTTNDTDISAALNRKLNIPRGQDGPRAIFAATTDLRLLPEKTELTDEVDPIRSSILEKCQTSLNPSCTKWLILNGDDRRTFAKRRRHGYTPQGVGIDVQSLEEVNERTGNYEVEIVIETEGDDEEGEVVANVDIMVSAE